MSTSDRVYNYAVRPNQGVGPVDFGMTRDEVHKAMGRNRAKVAKNEHRLEVDQFHGVGFQVIYMGRPKTAIAIKVINGGDIWGRIVLRPRYLKENGFHLFGRSPQRVLERLAKDAECDQFVTGHPGDYCCSDLGIILHYCDFNDRSFNALHAVSAQYQEKYPPKHRVAELVRNKA